MKPGRNDPCPCGRKGKNGRPVKFKKCCIHLGTDSAGGIEFGPVPDSVKAETDRMFHEAGYTEELAERIRSLQKQRKLRRGLTAAAVFGMLGYRGSG